MTIFTSKNTVEGRSQTTAPFQFVLVALPGTVASSGTRASGLTNGTALQHPSGFSPLP